MGFFIFFFFALVMVGAAVAGIRQAERARQAWTAAAAALGLHVESGSIFRRPEMEGELGGFPIKLDTFTSGGENKTTYTRYRVFYPSFDLGLDLKPQSAFSRITKIFGAQDVELGDQAFDDALMVKAEKSKQVASFLTPGRRSAILRLFADFNRARVRDDSIEIVTRGFESSQQRLLSTTRRVAATARRLHRMDGDGAIDDLLEARRNGDLMTASHELSTVVKPHPDDLDGRLIEVETLAAAGQREDAAAAVEAVAEVLAGDPEVEGWRELLSRPTPPPPAPEPMSPAENDRLFETLFGANLMSYETTKIFDERFRGRPVEWTGTVKRAKSYSSDLDFGPGPGMKAVITVARIEHDLYGETEIDAVVQLPASATLTRGDQVTFTGLLSKADPMMRNLYVTGGHVV